MARSIKNLRDIVTESRLNSDVNAFNFKSFENDLKTCDNFSSNGDLLKVASGSTGAKIYNSIFDMKNNLSIKKKSETEDSVNELVSNKGNKGIKLLHNKTNDNLKTLQTFLKNENNFCDFCHFWLSTFNKKDRRQFFHKKSQALLQELPSNPTNYVDFSQQHLTSFVNDYFNVDKTNTKNSFLPNFKQNISLHYSQLKHIITLTCHEVFWSDKNYIEALQDLTIVFIWRKFLEEIKTHTPNTKRKKKRLRERKMSEIEKKLYEIEKSYGAYSSDDDEESYNTLNDSKASRMLNENESHINRLMAAMSKNLPDVVDFMIETNLVDLHYKDSNDKNFLFHCIIINRPAIMRCLISKAQQRGDLPNFVNNTSSSGNSALHACINTNNQECLKILLSTPHIQVDAPNLLCGSATPLHLAIMHGRTALAEMLLEAGADPSKGMQDKSMQELFTTFSPPPALTSIIKRYSDRLESRH